jgi:hypothetical protein
LKVKVGQSIRAKTIVPGRNDELVPAGGDCGVELAFKLGGCGSLLLHLVRRPGGDIRRKSVISFVCRQGGGGEENEKGRSEKKEGSR